MVPYSGVAIGNDGKALAGENLITFQIFKEEFGGEPVWTESQAIALDAAGRYKVQLGATSPNGLPSNLFATGEARWLEIQIAGQSAQPRVLMASVPYALKAGDAATLGGLPASAFALAGTAAKSGEAVSDGATSNVASDVTTTGGTAGYLPLFNGANTVIDSVIFQNAKGIGINDQPNAALDVTGEAIFRGPGAIARMGNATPSTAYNSYPFSFNAQAYDSAKGAGIGPSFSIQAEPTGNDTASPGATLNLLYNNGLSSSSSETGLHFNSNGTINFAPGQTFPGTGTGTITGVTAGTALTGGGTSGNVTLNVDVTKIPELAKSNTFTTSQTIANGDLNLPATTGPNVGVLNIGGVPFLQGYTAANRNVFVGNAGNFTTTGSFNTGLGPVALFNQSSGFENTAVGYGSLFQTTTGYENTAVGLGALYSNTTGSSNTAVGLEALYSNATGSQNTAVGESSGPVSGALNNTTAVGYQAKVGQSNTLVLGNTSSTPGAEFVNVGVGTETPVSALEISVNAPAAVGPALTLTNGATGAHNLNTGNAVAIDFYTVPSSSGLQPSAQIEAVDAGSSAPDYTLGSLVFSTSGNSDTLQQDMIIEATGEVVIAGSSPDNAVFTVYNGDVDNPNGISTAGVSGITPGAGIVATGGTNTSPYGNPDDNGGIGGMFIGGDGGFEGCEDGPSCGGVGGDAILAQTNSDTQQLSPGYAGVFEGDVLVDGTLSANAKNFQIDHPLDPANKYLVHTSVESSEMMNIYSGNITTDELGLATVQLPAWFQAENGDFRYQLTVIGGRFAQAIVSREIADNKFTIRTNASNVKVSWQVTAVRQDAYAKAHPLVVELKKPRNEIGFYQHPELYGQPADKQTQWGRHPREMKQLKEAQERRRREALETVKSVKGTASKPAPRYNPPASAVNRRFETAKTTPLPLPGQVASTK